MDRKQAKFIKDLENKSVVEIAQFIHQGGISWEELIYNSAGKFPMVKQRKTLAELENLRNPKRADNDSTSSSSVEKYGDNNQEPELDNETESIISSAESNENYQFRPNDSGIGACDEKRQVETPHVEKVVVSSRNSNIFSYKGRVGRLAWFGMRILLNVFFYVIGNLTADPGLIIVFLLLWLPIMWVSICVNSKRCHDIGWSGWFQIIPFIGLLLLFWPGDKFENEYGPARR